MFFIGVTPIVGRGSGIVPAMHTDLLTKHGSAGPRTTPTQKLMVLDTVEPRDENSAR